MRADKRARETVFERAHDDPHQKPANFAVPQADGKDQEHREIGSDVEDGDPFLEEKNEEYGDDEEDISHLTTITSSISALSWNGRTSMY